MISINVNTSNRRYGAQLVDETVDTPRTVFERLNISYQGATPMLSGTILRDVQLDSTLAELGATNGSTLSATVKGDGGSI